MTGSSEAMEHDIALARVLYQALIHARNLVVKPERQVETGDLLVVAAMLVEMLSSQPRTDGVYTIETFTEKWLVPMTKELRTIFGETKWEAR